MISAPLDNPGEQKPAESDSSITLTGTFRNGVEGTIVTNVHVRDVDGDFVAVSGLREGFGGGGGEPTTDVTIVNSKFNRCGSRVRMS